MSESCEIAAIEWDVEPDEHAVGVARVVEIRWFNCTIVMMVNDRGNVTFGPGFGSADRARDRARNMAMMNFLRRRYPQPRPPNGVHP